MNESLFSSSATDTSPRTGDRRARGPDVPAQQGGAKVQAAATGLVEQAAQGAHHTIDRVADKATPAIRQLGESASAAGQALHDKTDQLRETRDEWVEDLRITVRSNPLGSVAAAFALGAVFARLMR